MDTVNKYVAGVATLDEFAPESANDLPLDRPMPKEELCYPPWNDPDDGDDDVPWDVHCKKTDDRLPPDASDASSQAFFAPCFNGDDSSGEHNREVGACGERAAALYLERQDYCILERNWRCKAGEADIIALDGDCLVLCEVKTRMNLECGMPEEAVDARKRDRYERIAAWYLKDWTGGDTQVRFDVVSVMVLAEDRALIRHHVNAWGAGA